MKYLFFLLLNALCINALAQAAKPATWNFEAKKTAANEYDLILKARIKPNTHVYSQYIGNGGPIPTSFHFDQNQNYTLVDSVIEKSKPIKTHDKMFDMDLLYYEDSAVFVQHIKVVHPVIAVTGQLVFMACDNTKCYPPSKLDFTFDLPK